MLKRILAKIVIILITELIIAVLFTSLFFILLTLKLSFPKTPFSYNFIMFIWAVCAIIVPVIVSFAESRIRQKLAPLKKK
jgi:hypothetical protein